MMDLMDLDGPNGLNVFCKKIRLQYAFICVILFVSKNNLL